MRIDLVAAAFAKIAKTESTAGVDIGTGGQVTLAAIGVAAIGWGAKALTGKFKEDAAERIELRKLLPIVADLQVAVAKCEAHREHDGSEMKRLARELEEVKKYQAERLQREIS